MIPIGSTSWWNGVKSGQYPQSVKLGTRMTAWKASDIHALIEKIEGGKNMNNIFQQIKSHLKNNPHSLSVSVP